MEESKSYNALVGFEKLQSYLEKQINEFQSIKIANTFNDKTNWRKEFNSLKAADNVALLMDYLTEWDQKNYTWWILLFKNKVQVERFPFTSEKTGIGSMPLNNGIDPAFVNQLVESERRAAIAEYQMSEMAKEMLEEDDDDDDEDQGIMGAITEQVMPQIIPMIPELLAGFIESLKNKNKPLQVSGIPDEITELVEVLLANGVTPDHLRKLADMAQNQKTKFKSLLLML